MAEFDDDDRGQFDRKQNVTECQCCCYSMGRLCRCDLHEFFVPDVVGCCCGWYTLRVGVLLFSSIDFAWYGGIFLRSLLTITLPEEYQGRPTDLFSLGDDNWIENMTDTEFFCYIGLTCLVASILSMVGVYAVFNRSILCLRFYAVFSLVVLILVCFMPFFYKDAPKGDYLLWNIFFVISLMYTWWKFVISYNLVDAWLQSKSGDERNVKTLTDTADFTHPCVNKYSCICICVQLLLFALLLFLGFRYGRYHEGTVIE